jgi:hypothetical protein
VVGLEVVALALLQSDCGIGLWAVVDIVIVPVLVAVGKDERGGGECGGGTGVGEV